MAEWVNIVAGFGVGMLVGMTGVGGGALMTPIMVLLFGIAPVTAVGTDLWFAAITKMVGGWIHGKKGTIDYPILRRMFCGSLPAASLTLLWLYLGGPHRNHGSAISHTLGAMLILTSGAAAFRPYFHALGERLRASRSIEFKSLQLPLTVLGGALLGFLVTFTSIGAGALGAVMLLYLYPRRMTASSLVGTDIVHAIPLTILSGTGHLLMGNVNINLLGTLLIGSVPGILIGSLIGVHAPEKLLRTMISFMLVLVGFKMVMT